MNKYIKMNKIIIFCLAILGQAIFCSNAYSQHEDKDVITTKWEATIESYYSSYPYIIDNLVFVGIDKDNAYNAITGEAVRLSTGILEAKKLFISNNKEGNLIELNTGNILYTINRSRKMYPKWYWPQLVKSNSMVTTKNTYELIAVKVEDKNDTITLWNYKSTNKVRENFVYHDNLVVFSDKRTVICAELETGKIQWQRKFEKINTILKSINGVCFFVADGYMNAINISDGKVNWKSEYLSDQYNLHNFQLSKDVIIVNLGNIFQLDTKNGNLMYKSIVRFWGSKGGVIYKKYYIGVAEPESDDAPLLIVDMEKDEIVYENYDRYNGISHFSNTMVGNLFYYSTNGKVYCLEVNL